MHPVPGRHQHHRRLLVALLAAVLAIVVALGAAVDAHASTPAAPVVGTGVAAHDPDVPVVAAAGDVLAGEDRRTTTRAAKEVGGSRVAAGNPAVGSTTASFDRVGRLTKLDYSDTTPDVSFGYDPVGNRVSMADGVGVETRAYDDADQVVEVRRGADVFAYSYDAAGNVTGRTYPDGTVVASAYGADNRLGSVTAGGSTTGYAYDLAGQLLTTSLPNGIVTTRAHDQAGRLEPR